MVIIEKPVISLYGPAIRTQNWLQLYNNINDSSIPFELIFVGPNEPDFTLPDNFKYIKSNVKPTQCLEIAARHTSGELLLNFVDDVAFTIPDSLGELYRNYIRYNDEKLMLSCRYMVNGEDASYECHRFYVKDPTSPIMPIGGLLSKKLYQELGGVDRNFMAVYWDLDMALRLYAIGGRVLLSDNVYLNEVTSMSLGTSIVLESYGGYDRGLLHNLWIGPDDRVQFNRSQPFEPFLDERILEETQGPKGRWP